jgi:hypothetical protein
MTLDEIRKLRSDYAMQHRCEMCLWFEPQEAGPEEPGDRGFCHIRSWGRKRWPLRLAYDWCGEFEPICNPRLVES